MKLKPTGDNGIVLVHPNGLTTLDFGTRIELTCSMSACLFPIDTHKCPLTFISIAQNSNMLVLVPDDETRENYKDFSETATGLWEIKTHGFRDISRYQVTTGGYLRHMSILETSLTFKHKPNHYWLHLLFPIALICAVTFGAVLFPRESGDRTSLLITCFLAQFVYLDTVLHIVPRTSDYVPLLIIFMYVVLVFTACQIGLTAICAYYADKANKKTGLSSWHRRIIICLSKICLLSKNEVNAVKSAHENSSFKNEVQLRSIPVSESTNPSNATSISDTIEHNQTEVNTENEAPKGEIGTPPNICRVMCKLVDRFSIILSLIVLVTTPIIFQLIYNGTIHFNCRTYPEN